MRNKGESNGIFSFFKCRAKPLEFFHRMSSVVHNLKLRQFHVTKGGARVVVLCVQDRQHDDVVY
jgi:hypothetical protein